MSTRDRVPEPNHPWMTDTPWWDTDNMWELPGPDELWKRDKPMLLPVQLDSKPVRVVTTTDERDFVTVETGGIRFSIHADHLRFPAPDEPKEGTLWAMTRDPHRIFEHWDGWHVMGSDTVYTWQEVWDMVLESSGGLARLVRSHNAEHHLKP